MKRHKIVRLAAQGTMAAVLSAGVTACVVSSAGASASAV